MGSSTALTDPAARLVADASTVINLIATGSAGDIIAALPNRIARRRRRALRIGNRARARARRPATG